MSTSIEDIRKEIEAYRKSRSFICEIKMTTRCNMHCSYCYQKEKNNCVIKPELVENVFDELAEYYEGPLVCCFHGGEPLLAFNTIMGIIERLDKKDYRNRIRYTMQSNGTLLNQDVLDNLSRKNVSIGLSIDACTKNGNACRVLRNGENVEAIISDVIPEINKKLKGFSTTCVVTKKNINELVDYLIWCYESGVDAIGFNYVRITKEENEKRDLMPDINQYIDVTKELIDTLIKLNKKGKKKIYIYEVSNIVNKIISPYYDSFICNSPCEAGKRIICLNIDGRIDRCDCLGNTRLNTMGYYKKGHLKDVLDKAKSSDFAIIKEDIEECKICDVKKYCPNGCVANNYIYYGKKDINHPGLMCNWYKEIIHYLIDIINTGINLEFLTCE